MRKSYWQDWVLICGTLVLIAVASFVMGCSEPQPVRNYPVVMVFTAQWCPNCPNAVELDELAADFPGVMILPVDIDADPVLALKYNVKSVPRYFLCTDDYCWTTSSLSQLRERLEQLQ